MKQYGIPVLIMSLLTGCAKTPMVMYHPNDFINPNKVVEKKIAPTSSKVVATFGYDSDPFVLEAYQTYLKSGRAPNIQSQGFMTKPYNAHTRYMVACAPLHLCVVQLESGENINNIELGDSANWLVHPSLIGSPQNGSYQVAFKPKQAGLATDMIITTTKRTYQLGLVSKEGSSSQILSFYYPEDTLTLHTHELHDNNAVASEHATSTVMQLDKLNFNYTMTGSSVPWQPTRIFDDGDKTYIQMPALVERMDLPVIYVQKEKGMAIINYRYKRPYYIIDSLFKTAYLIDGKGRNQMKVVIHNCNIA